MTPEDEARAIDLARTVLGIEVKVFRFPDGCTVEENQDRQ